VLHSKANSSLYPQIFNQAGKACQQQILSFLPNSGITAVKRFITFGPGRSPFDQNFLAEDKKEKDEYDRLHLNEGSLLRHR
jgi:hypothetical protein